MSSAASPALPWSDVHPLSFAPPGSAEPALLVAGEVLHLVFCANKTLYHARLSLAAATAEWQPPTKFASGEAPALAATPDGRLYCAFTNSFLGNCEVYCAAWDGQKWSLPQVVSRTSGVSTSPALAAGPDGSLHAVWADTTPGRSTIYYGRKADVAWTSGPIPSGAGSYPALAIAPDGELLVAWQDRLDATAVFEVLSASRKAGVWSIPEIISDTPQRHSLYPKLACNPKGNCHIVWQEQAGATYVIRSAERLPGGWAPPGDLSDPGTDCRLARVLPRSTSIFQAFWACGPILRHRARPAESRAFWWQAETAQPQCEGISHLAAAIDANGITHLVWSAYNTSSQRQLFHARREPVPMQGIFIPIFMG
jgi:hypothetical protein